jgi:signal transduction histidine kinase
VWERRLSAVAGVVPYLLLAVSTVLALLTGGQPGAGRLELLLLAVLAGAWVLGWISLHPAWGRRRAFMAVYFAGLLALIAVLMQRSPWFGLFAFTGYLHAWRYLPGGWRIAGVTLTAILSTTWQIGGLPLLTLPAIFSYLVLIGITVTLVSVFSYMGEVTVEQSKQRKKMIAELAEANHRLAAMLEENAGLHAKVLAQAREAGVLDERQRLAGEIHDTLAQNLAGIITQLEAAGQNSRQPDQWQRYVDQALMLSRESLNQARRSVQALRPETLEVVPLPEAIRRLAEGWSDTSGIALHCETTGNPQPLLAEIETTLYRVAQEALTNIARHSQANRVGLTLSYMEDVVLLDVRDDGIGFDANQMMSNGRPDAVNGFGLRGMGQRVRRVAGTLEIESAPGEGATIHASVPSIPAADGG